MLLGQLLICVSTTSRVLLQLIRGLETKRSTSSLCGVVSSSVSAFIRIPRSTSSSHSLLRAPFRMLGDGWKLSSLGALPFAHQESEIFKITSISPRVFGSILTFPLPCVAPLCDAHYWGWELAIHHGHRAEANVLRFSLKLMSVCQGSTAQNQHDCASM